MPNLSRRTLLALAGGIAVLPFAPTFWRDGERAFVQRIVYRNIPGVIFDGGDLDLLVEDIAATYERPLSYERVKHIVGVSVDSNLLAQIDNPLTRRLTTAYEYPVMNAFFMATDFFPEGYREGRRISFLHSCDPYRGCVNPLARFEEA